MRPESRRAETEERVGESRLRRLTPARLGLVSFVAMTVTGYMDSKFSRGFGEDVSAGLFAAELGGIIAAVSWSVERAFPSSEAATQASNNEPDRVAVHVPLQAMAPLDVEAKAN